MSDDGFGFSITVVGLGLIGGSYAEALKSLGAKNVWGVDIDEDALKTAEQMGIIDSGYTNAEVPLRKSDIVVVALYPKCAIEFMKNNMDYFKSGAVITDTAGIKNEVVTGVNEMLRDDLDFVGGHPMAGKEGQGLEMASKDIFKNANYIITPTEKNRDKNIKIISRMAKQMGCRKVIELSACKHDKIIAFTSQLPHILAVSLINSMDFDELASFVGGSFRDATRVAINNSDLWTELLIENKTNIIDIIENAEKKIKCIKEAIKNDDINSLRGEFKQADSRRKEIV